MHQKTIFSSALLTILLLPSASAVVLAQGFTRDPAETLRAPSVPWQAEVDGAEAVAVPERASLSAPVPRGFATLRTASTSSRWLIVGGLGGRDASIHDLMTGRALRVHPQINVTDRTAISHDAQRMAIWFDDAAARQRVISIGAPNANREMARIELPRDGTLAWVDFVAADRVAALTTMPSREAKLEAWELPAGRSVWTVEGLSQTTVATVTRSPGGRYVAVFTDDREKAGVRIIDVTSGDLVGELPVEKPNASRPRAHELAFSPDGKELGGLFEIGRGIDVLVWDFETGERRQHIELPSEIRPDANLSYDQIRRLEFMGENHLVVGGQIVVDRSIEQWIHKIPDDRAGTNRLPMRVVDGATLLKLDKNARGEDVVVLERIDSQRLAHAAEVRQAGGEGGDLLLPRLTEANVAEAATGELGKGDGRWRVEADPAPETSRLLRRPLPLAAEGAGNRLLLARAMGGAALLCEVTTNIRGSGPETMQLLDLTGGFQPRALTLQVAPTTRAGALSPGGTRLAVVTDETRIDLFSLPEGEHLVGWRAVDSDGGPARRVLNVEFVDEARLAVGTDVEVQVWDSGEAKLIWSRRAGNLRGMTSSPGGRYLVVLAGQVTFVDPAEGEVKGVLAASDALSLPLWFKPDGTAVAAIRLGTPQELLRWDLRTGEAAEGIRLQPSVRGAVHWVEDELVMIGNYLVDLNRRMAVWRYEGLRVLPQSADGRVWHVVQSRSGPGVLSAAVVPDAAARRAAAGAAAGPEVLIGPGGRVSIEAQLEAAERDRLVARLQREGVEVVDDAPIRLVSSISTEQLGSQDYLVGGRTETVQRSRTVRRLAWETRSGETLWETREVAETGSAMTVITRGDETIQDRLGGQEQAARTRAFGTASVPIFMYADADTTIAGTSPLPGR